jgi:hypothetical protein
MAFKYAAILIVSVWIAGLAQATTAQTPTKDATQPAAASKGVSTWSGVYTDEQAKNGTQGYTKACAECHLEDMAGDGFAPPLKGPEFMNNWNSLTVGDLFERIRISMPPSDPNSVTAKEKADIVAYILKAAGFPAGTTELASQTEPLKAIKFEATKPGAN